MAVDIGLLFYFVFWYAGNYFYNISNKKAMILSGGSEEGFPMTVSTIQLGVGVLYALFLWSAPDARQLPKRFTMSHVLQMLPVGFCNAGAHSASVFALGAGSVSFGQIVKAAEPVFAALVGTLVYGKPTSLIKWMCLIPVIGGVALASVKELDFSMAALISASVANFFAAFKGQESKRLMNSDIKQDFGSVGNQFAITTIISFFMSLVVMFVKEGDRFPEFLELVATHEDFRKHLILSGLTFYGYNELATMTLKKTSGVTQSVANTAKRVIIIVGTALVFGESLEFMKMVGCSIAIGGVFIYSSIESIFPPKKGSEKKA